MASDMDGDDLDAELLAVTATQRDTGDSSGSEGLYEGEASSESDHDDGGRSGGSDGEDSDMYSADEDDEDDADYGVKSTSKKPKKRGRPAKKAGRPRKSSPSTKRKLSTKRRKGAGRRKRARTETDVDDEEEEVFHHMYDREGYKDDEDRIKLMKMNELDRETLLMERMEERRKAEELWNMKKSLEKRERKKSARTSTRSKATKKSDALQALKEGKAKKSKGISRTLMDVSDDEEELPVAKDKRSGQGEPEEEADSKRKESAERRIMETRPFCYEDLVYSDGSTTPLYLRRALLEHLIQQPNGTRAITGLFVKLNVGNFRGESTYKLCQIVGTEKSKRYSIGKEVVNKKAVLKIGNETQAFYIHMVSNKRPAREEFDAWHRKMREEGLDLMSRREVDELLEHAKKVINNKLGSTPEEVKEHIASMEILHPERVNWTQKKALIKAQIEQLGDEIKTVKQQETSHGYSKIDEEARTEISTKTRTNDLLEKLETLKADLAIAESNEAEYTRPKERRSKTSLFAHIARKNQQLNDEAGSLAASRRLSSDRAKSDPFARLDTTAGSYFAIGKKDEEETKVRSEDIKEEAKVGDTKERGRAKDWLGSLLPDLSQGSEARKISDKPLVPEYGFKITGLEIFDLDEHELREKFPLAPSPSPGIDAVYATPSRAQKPQGRIIDFAAWRKLNQA